MEESFKLYVGNSNSFHTSLRAAQEEAKKYIPDELYLRIECLSGSQCGDWWAYEYKNNKWSRS